MVYNFKCGFTKSEHSSENCLKFLTNQCQNAFLRIIYKAVQREQDIVTFLCSSPLDGEINYVHSILAAIALQSGKFISHESNRCSYRNAIRMNNIHM